MADSDASNHTLSDEVIEACSELLAEIETLDADELVERLGEWEDAFRSAGVVDLD